MERAAQESLRPADLVTLLKVHLAGGSWTYSSLAHDLGVSSSRVHDSLRRAARAHLFELSDRRVLLRNLEEFLLHGVRFAFPAVVGAVALGVPTGAYGPPMRNLLSAGGDRMVWAHVGPDAVKGQTIIPLHPNVPEIALRDERMHQLLALIDSLRLGGSREREVAAKALKERLGSSDA